MVFSEFHRAVLTFKYEHTSMLFTPQSPFLSLSASFLLILKESFYKHACPIIITIIIIIILGLGSKNQ
jgi:hypothetical protein